MIEPPDLERVYRYHDGTKHHFDRFARSLGYLDWASQPRPFRSFEGSPPFSFLQHADRPGLPGSRPSDQQITYDQLFASSRVPALPLSAASLGDFFRHSLALSAWKVFRDSRWALRVNPSSGNLHPTEAYLITGPIAGLDPSAGVWHYAADRHAVERRCVFDAAAWPHPAGAFLVALTSIHWREAWKYGERAFRYCQHDLGHAIAALRMSAALCGWHATLQPGWPQRAVASLTGIDRDHDYIEAEREQPACLLLVSERRDAESRGGAKSTRVDTRLLEAVREARWFGRASQLSEDHVQWTFIDEVARATEDPGHELLTGAQPPCSPVAIVKDRDLDAKTIVLQRRSAVALDGGSATDRDTFLSMLSRTLPGDGAPWDALWWSPRIHLALFVHRVEGLAPGLYLLARDPAAVPRLQAACAKAFTWTAVTERLPIWLLQAGDYRARARRVSCNQEIAADGFFSLGMIADFDASLVEFGPSFYRQLFWESGVVGQVLYLEAEAAGARATGIGCFFDDPVHEMLGLAGHAFQSLYHFTVGIPVEDARLTTEPAYATRP